jgi:hypothetical protein
MFDSAKKRIDWTQGNPRVATPGWTTQDSEGTALHYSPSGDYYGGDATPWWHAPNWQDYQADNQWSALDDPSSPFWQARGGYDSNPHTRASTLLDAAAGDQPILQLLMGPQWGPQIEDRFAGTGLNDATIGEMKGTLGATGQDLASHDFFSMLESSLIPGLMTAFGGPAGAAAAGAAGSAYHDGNIGDMLKSAGVAGGTAWLGQTVGAPTEPTLDPTGLGAGDFTIDESGVLGGSAPKMLPNGSNFGMFSQPVQVAQADPSAVTDIAPGMLTPQSNFGTMNASVDAPAWMKTGPTLAGPASVVGPEGTSTYVGDPTTAAAAGASWSPPSLEQALNPSLTMPDAAPLQQQPAKKDITAQDVQRYAKIAKSVADVVGASKPQGAPERADGQSNEEYASSLAQYLNLDAQAMADQGLTPGSPEYMDYILQQADSVIAQVLGDANPDSADFAAQLRTKTAQEMQQLTRALYVRGQLDQMMGAGHYTDPFSGATQDVIGSGMFNPHVAAFQRGKAQDVTNLAGLRGNDALSKIQGMLGRNSDLWGMQGAADARFDQAKLAEEQQQQDELRRRRGMFG